MYLLALNYHFVKLNSVHMYLPVNKDPSEFSKFDIREAIFSERECTPITNDNSTRSPFQPRQICGTWSPGWGWCCCGGWRGWGPFFHQFGVRIMAVSISCKRSPLIQKNSWNRFWQKKKLRKIGLNLLNVAALNSSTFILCHLIALIIVSSKASWYIKCIQFSSKCLWKSEIGCKLISQSWFIICTKGIKNHTWCGFHFYNYSIKYYTKFLYECTLYGYGRRTVYLQSTKIEPI